MPCFSALIKAFLFDLLLQAGDWAQLLRYGLAKALLQLYLLLATWAGHEGEGDP